MTDIDLEREAIRQLGESMEALESSVAWKFLRGWLEAEVTRAKGIAAVTVPGVSNAYIRDVFTAWQEREKVATGLDSKIQDTIEEYKQMLEVEKDERTNIDRSGW